MTTNDTANSTAPRHSPAEPDETAVDVLGPAAALDAQARGRAAALAGQPATACPWRDATTPPDLAARAMWVRGYAAGRTVLRQPLPLDQDASGPEQ